MKITIISIFRDAESHIGRYFSQIDDLRREVECRRNTLNLVLGYGDSTDGTEPYLFEEAIQRGMDISLNDVSHGGKKYGSIEHPERFKQLAIIGNRLLDLVSPDTDIVGFVESDLIWKPNDIQALLEDLLFVSAVAPMIMDGPASFYDVFAFRRYGGRFTKNPPYFPEYTNPGFFRMESVGSMLFLDSVTAKKARFSEDEAIVGFCKNLRANGTQIYLDSEIEVFHP